MTSSSLRPAARPVPGGFKHGVARVLEAGWAAGFSLAGWLRPPALGRWSTPGAQRVLVIAPHPDDEAAGCAGTLVRHRQDGDAVCVVHVTDGRQSRALGLAPDAMAARRRQEAQVCAELLGVERLEWLGLPEGAWAPEALPPRLSGLLAALAPDVLYVPSRVDFHPEHIKTAWAIARALEQAPAAVPKLRVRVYAVQVPLTSTLANLVTDVSGVSRLVEGALGSYASQWGSLARSQRMRRYAARQYGLTGLAEEFWDLSAPAYCQLHAGRWTDWTPAPYRSLRPAPFDDVLAYTAGQGSRRTLAQQLAQTVTN